MSIVLQGSTSGSITLQEPAVAGSNTISLPAATGTAVLTGVSGNVDINAAGSNNVTLSTNSTERVRVDSSGNVGIGTSSPSSYNASADNLVVAGSVDSGITVASGTTSTGYVIFADGTTGTDAYTGYIGYNHGSNYMQFHTNGGSERMRITSGGRLNIGTTGGSATRLEIEGGETVCAFINTSATDANYKTTMAFTDSGGTTRGTIRVNNSATQYNTSSDYRLKENIAPMSGALAKVQSLKPCTYTWKIDGHGGQGFIAHELAEIFPDAVAGEKDAVETYTDEEGNEQTRPIYQGVDTSFLVATLTAAIQEQQAQLTNMSLTLANANAMIEELKARIETLEAK